MQKLLFLDGNSIMKIGIIGAGPAGISCAYQLAQKNIEVDLYEADSVVGGMAKTIELWNQKVDLGPHRFFSSDPRVNQLWLDVIGDDYEMVNRLTRIYYKNKFFYYPLKPFDVLSKLSYLGILKGILSYGKEKLFPTEQDGTFETWVIKRFGQYLFDCFFKTYTEKLWGISCAELDADFAAQRIKKLSMYEAVKTSLVGNRNHKHRTLLDQFAYPKHGTGEIYYKMAECIQKNKGRIFLSTPVLKVIKKGNTAVAIETIDSRIKFYDHIVSTMPISDVVGGFSDVPPEVSEATKTLRYRNTILVYLRVKQALYFPDNWLYIHSPDLLMGRLTNFKNWVPAICNGQSDTILALEYWCFDSDSLWTMDDDKLIHMANLEMEKTGLLGNGKISDGYVRRIHRSYPVYYKGYKSRLKKIEDYLDTIKNLTLIGRNGTFKYNNQDHSILMGILAAENIAAGKAHNLWDINTDYEYQEKYAVTETGFKTQRDCNNT